MCTAMIVPACSHNYCALCIRRYMSFRNECPTCRIGITDLDLRNNRVLDEIIKHFKTLRTKFDSGVKAPMTSGTSALKADDTLKKDSNSVTPKPSPKGKRLKSRFQAKPGSKKRIFHLSDSDDDDTISDADFVPPAPSRKRTRVFELDENSSTDDVMVIDKPTTLLNNNTPSKQDCLNTNSNSDSTTDTSMGLQLGSTNMKAATSSGMSPGGGGASASVELKSPTPYTSADPSETVSCPICGSLVKQKIINLHLDRCLDNAIPRPTRQSAAPKRKTLPKLVYNLMKDGDIRKRLSEVGLSTQGDRKTLTKRHREYTLIYNTQCDSLNPKSRREIVQEMQRAASNSIFQASSSRPNNGLKVNKGDDTGKIENAQKEYMKEHKIQFKQLIDQTRTRMVQPKSKDKQESSNKEDLGDSLCDLNKPELPSLHDLNEPLTPSEKSDSQHLLSEEPPTLSPVFTAYSSPRDVKQTTGAGVPRMSSFHSEASSKDLFNDDVMAVSDDNNADQSTADVIIAGVDTKMEHKEPVKELFGGATETIPNADPDDNDADSQSPVFVSSVSKPETARLQFGEGVNSNSFTTSPVDVSGVLLKECTQQPMQTQQQSQTPQQQLQTPQQQLQTQQQQLQTQQQLRIQQHLSQIQQLQMPEQSQTSQSSTEDLAWLSQRAPDEDSQAMTSQKSSASGFLPEVSDDERTFPKSESTKISRDGLPKVTRTKRNDVTRRGPVSEAGQTDPELGQVGGHVSELGQDDESSDIEEVITVFHKPEVSATTIADDIKQNGRQTKTNKRMTRKRTKQPSEEKSTAKKSSRKNVGDQKKVATNTAALLVTGDNCESRSEVSQSNGLDIACSESRDTRTSRRRKLKTPAVDEGTDSTHDSGVKRPTKRPKKSTGATNQDGGVVDEISDLPSEVTRSTKKQDGGKSKGHADKAPAAIKKKAKTSTNQKKNATDEVE